MSDVVVIAAVAIAGGVLALVRIVGAWDRQHADETEWLQAFYDRGPDEP